jgi:hypothetical protein
MNKTTKTTLIFALFLSFQVKGNNNTLRFE